MGGASSVQARRAHAPSATAASSTVTAEEAAVQQLRLIEDGSQCLAGGEHCWRDHEGQTGLGRACERCLRTEDTQCKPTRVVFKIQPQCECTQPTAVSILELWRAEMKRCSIDGGCVAGGEHCWVDVRKTLVRLTGDGRCCQKCGLIESVVSPLVAALGEKPAILCLPNLIGLFGPPIPPEYRKMYGAGGAGKLLQLNTPHEAHNQAEHSVQG